MIVPVLGLAWVFPNWELILETRNDLKQISEIVLIIGFEKSSKASNFHFGLLIKLGADECSAGFTGGMREAQLERRDCLANTAAMNYYPYLSR
jgi:hypothetical protein